MVQKVRNVTKSLAGMEDFQQLRGPHSQTRNGNAVTVHGMDVPYAVDTVAEMQALDLERFQHARVYSAPTTYVDYLYDVDNITGVPSDNGGGTWLARIFEAPAQVATIADLRTFEPDTAGQQIDLLGHTYQGVGGGKFYYDASDTASSDNNITVVVTTGGKRWKRPDVRVVEIEWGGLDNTGATDDSALMQAVVNLGLPMTAGVGTFQFNVVNDPNTSVFKLTGASSILTVIDGVPGYQGYVIQTDRGYDIRSLRIRGGGLDGQYAIGSNVVGSGGGSVVIKNVVIRSIDQGIYFGEEYEHPIGLTYDDIYVQGYRTAAINLGGDNGPTSDGESCWSLDNVRTPNQGQVNPVYVHATQNNVPSTSQDTITWTGDSPDFGYLVLRSAGTTDWHIPPNWTSANYAALSFVADKEVGETWFYRVLRMTVGTNIHRAKVVNIGVLQNEYCGIGLRLDTVKACNIGSHYYEIRNPLLAQGGFASIYAGNSTVAIQTSRAELAGYNIYTASNSKVHAGMTISSNGTIAVFGNGGATAQLVTHGYVSLGGTPKLYHAPNNGSNDYNYEALIDDGARLAKVISHSAKAEHEFQFRGVKKGSIFADATGCTAEISRLDLKLTSKTMTPLVVNNIGGTTLVDAVATDVLDVDVVGNNGSSSLRLHYKVIVLDGASVTRQTESGWLDIDTVNVATTTPTVMVSTTSVHQLLNQGTLSTAFTASAVAGSFTVECNANTNVAAISMKLELTPISLLGNLENIVQL
tara:strand:+ start:20469 stop:22724 length:2256 start_codon:yes stop_codon:yes gene_type:complete